MTSSGRYTHAREILSKKAIKVLLIIKRSFSNIASATIAIKNKLFNALVKPVLLMRAKFGNQNYCHTKRTSIKAQLNKSALISSVNKH